MAQIDNNFHILKKVIYALVALVVLLGICVLCYKYMFKHKSESQENLDKAYLARIVTKTSLPEDSRKRVRDLLALYETKAFGTKPILIFAFITQAIGAEEPDLGICFFDKDANVLGIGITEEEIGKNKASIEETYPVFTHSALNSLHYGIIPIKLRSASEHKDPVVWAEYEKTNPESLVQWLIDNNTPERVPDWWLFTLPPVWVSNPDPNKLDVWVWVYDKAGNKSEPIELIR